MHPIHQAILSSFEYARLMLSRLGASPLPRRDRGDVRHGVLIVPGFLGSSAVTQPLERRFEAAGISAFSLNSGLYSAVSMLTMERLLTRRILGIRFHHSGLERLDLVAHSLGGLAALAVLQRMTLQGISTRLVTLGTPVYGTWTALLGCPFSPAAFELLPCHPRYRDPDALKWRRDIPLLSIAGEYDVLAPPERCRHPEGEYFVAHSVDHAGLLLNDTVFRLVRAFLER